MTAHDLLATCRARGIRLSRAGARLVADAPDGQLSADLLAALREHKADLLAALDQRAAEADLDAHEERLAILASDAGLPPEVWSPALALPYARAWLARPLPVARTDAATSEAP